MGLDEIPVNVTDRLVIIRRYTSINGDHNASSYVLDGWSSEGLL